MWRNYTFSHLKKERSLLRKNKILRMVLLFPQLVLPDEGEEESK